ncbi:hypothetical protein [Hyphomicrobium sp. D-2]|uniref:hypothetical protein n=1 Tax=Hyphomicrobium sp. D-2 TaxID=3041621 RepID=UPI00245616E2|nr:hypothetical protein [Hyphomicrobium sp. D-2]MDH4982603.1 hypothetical protein [Hyphomicrobium sp. D-2]
MDLDYARAPIDADTGVGNSLPHSYALQKFPATPMIYNDPKLFARFSASNYTRSVLFFLLPAMT